MRGCLWISCERGWIPLAQRRDVPALSRPPGLSKDLSRLALNPPWGAGRSSPREWTQNHVPGLLLPAHPGSRWNGPSWASSPGQPTASVVLWCSGMLQGRGRWITHQRGFTPAVTPWSASGCCLWCYGGSLCDLDAENELSGSHGGTGHGGRRLLDKPILRRDKKGAARQTSALGPLCTSAA